MMTSVYPASHKRPPRILTCLPSLFAALITCALITLSSAQASSATCELPCTHHVDYQHSQTELVFSRANNSQQQQQQQQQQSVIEASPGNPYAWRHRYEIVITQQGDSRVVFDQFGERHVFHPSIEGGYRSTSQRSGHLLSNSTGYQWVNAEGLTHQFHGSFLTQITFPSTHHDTNDNLVSTSTSSNTSNTSNSVNTGSTYDTNTYPHQNTNPSLSLRYRDNRLSSVTDEQGNQLLLSYSDDAVITVTTPTGETITYPARHCSHPLDTPDTNNEPTACDTAANPLPSHTLSQITAIQSQTLANITHLDARPASCSSYFVDYFGTERGSRIESAVQELAPYSAMEPTVRSFPIVDFIDGSELIILRSRDLSSASFNNPTNPHALFERLIRDGREIESRFLDPLRTHQQVSYTERGETTIVEASAAQVPVLQLLIQQHIASASHWAQIERARAQLMERFGIRLDVVLIP